MVQRLYASLFIMLTTISSWAIAQSDQPWRPTAGSKPGLPAECHPQLFAKNFLNKKDHDQRADLLKNTVLHCEQHWRAGHPQGLAAEKRLRDLDQAVAPSQHFLFLDRRGQSRMGWMWLQETKERRPAVVVSCDFNCDRTQSSWLKRVIHHLYEEGPFHIVVVLSPESQSSSEWTAGGLAYGQAIYEVGYWLQTAAPMRQRISGLQLFGEGWGAQGVLMALIYNQNNPIASDRNVFQGQVALCPVTDLGAATRVLEQPLNAAQSEMASALKNKFMDLRQSDERWRQWLTDWSWDSPVLSKWITASLAQSERWNFLKPFLLQTPRNERDWLQANDLAYQGLGIKMPSWLIGSNQDPRFKWTEHGARLANQNQNRAKSQLRTQVFNDESSCALGASLGWDFEGALWRSLLMGESHEIWPRVAWPILPWTAGAPQLNENETHLEQHWSVNTKGETRVEFFIQTNSGVRTEYIHVDTSDWPTELRPHAGSEAEAWRFTRLLNIRLRLQDENGQPLMGAKGSALRLSWLRWSSI